MAAILEGLMCQGAALDDDDVKELGDAANTITKSVTLKDGTVITRQTLAITIVQGPDKKVAKIIPSAIWLPNAKKSGKTFAAEPVKVMAAKLSANKNALGFMRKWQPRELILDKGELKYHKADGKEATGHQVINLLSPGIHAFAVGAEDALLGNAFDHGQYGQGSLASQISDTIAVVKKTDRSFEGKVGKPHALAITRPKGLLSQMGAISMLASGFVGGIPLAGKYMLTGLNEARDRTYYFDFEDEQARDSFLEKIQDAILAGKGTDEHMVYRAAPFLELLKRAGSEPEKKGDEVNEADAHTVESIKPFLDDLFSA
jgi:hypothetical protein